MKVPSGMRIAMKLLFSNRNIFLLLLVGLGLIPIFSQAQLDTQHWIPPMYTNGISNVEEQYIYLSTPSENPFTVRIMDGGCENLLAEIIISNDNPGRYTIGSRESIMVTALANKIAVPLQGMGVCLQAPEPFYANLRMQNSAQSGSLTAKGRIGTGTTFRTGKILEYELAINKNRSRSSFIGVLALEDDTRIRIADLPPELVITNSRRGEEFLTTLNKGESYILGVDMSMPNVTVESANAFMGALVESTNGKPIAVSCGGILSAPVANDGQDMGLDQPVPVEWIGNEYIAVRGNGGAVQERPIVIAHYNSTKVYVNGSNTPLVTLNEGEYFPIPTAYYESRGNMFIETDKPSYVYQMLSSTGRDVNLSLNFLPPINCFQPREVNNIADVNKIGNTQFTGGIILVTTSDAILEVEDDNGPVVLPAPTPVPGRVIFSTYRINNLVGDVKVVSDGAIQVGIFGQSGARGWAGYYAGFPTDVPFLTVVNDDPRDPNGRCYNGVTLKVIGTNYDKYFWYKDNEFLLEETSGSIFTGPYGAGEYSVKGLIENCGETLLSTSIPVEDCPDPLDVSCLSTTATVWLKPETMVHAANQLSSWEDASGNQTLLEMPFGLRNPANTLSTEDIENFYPTARLEGNRFLETRVLNSSLFRRQDELSMFAVYKAGNDGMVFSQGNIDSSQIGLSASRVMLGDNQNPLIFTVPVGDNLGLVNANRQAGQGTAFLNGAVNGQNTLQAQDWVNTRLSVGAQISPTDLPEAFFNGNLAELIVFPFAQDQLQREKIQTYLGLKYGFSLTHACTSSSGVELFDPASPFANDIAGIGIDDCTNLNHKQSKSRNATAILTVGLGDIRPLNSLNQNEFGEDLSYTLWGHDTAPLALERAITGNDTVGCLAMERSWMISEPLKEVATLKLAIPDTFPVSYLIISNDQDFSNGEETFIQLENDGQGNLTASHDFEDGQYLTFAIARVVAVASPDTSICMGESVLLSVNEASKYAWSTPTNNDLADGSSRTPTATITETGYFYIETTDVNGCLSRDSVLVSMLPLPPVEAGDDEEICLNEEIKLEASGALSYQWEAHPSLSATDIPTPTVTPTTTTTYRVVGTDANGCSHTDSVTVVVHELPIADAGADIAICVGDTTQLVGQGASQVNWQGTGLSDANISDPLVYPGLDQEYILTVTDENSCTDTDTVFVKVHALPNAEAGNDIAVCIGDSAQLSASGGIVYEWEAVAGISNRSMADPAVLVAASNTLTVKVTDANGCMAEDSVFVLVHPLPPVEAGDDEEICLNEEIKLEASGALSYQWEAHPSLSATDIPTPTVTPTTTTTYRVVGTDANGCSHTDSVTVVVHELPIADAGADIAICVGDTTQLVGQGASQVNWQGTGLSDTNISDPLAYPELDQEYILTVTDENSCTDTDTVFVKVHALPNAEAGNDIAVCIGDSAQLSASGGIVYEWEAVAGISNRSMADPYVLLAASNTLTVKVTDANGCMAEDSVFVLVHPLPPVEAGDDEEICLNEEIKLKASGALSYQWEAHPSLSATDILAPTVTPTTTTTYRVVGTDANGCSHTDSVTVVVHELPIADAGADTAICTGDTTQLAAKGGIRYTWENAPSLSETDVADPLAYPTQDQLYILTVTDIHNCTDRDSVFIQVYELPNAEAGDDIAVCIGDSTQLSATGGVSYEWEATNGMSDRLIATPKVLLAGSTNLRVQVTDANTCMAEDSVFVLVHPLPPVEAGEEQELCLNEEVQLGASGATSYQWEADASLSAINIADPMASPRATLIYTVEGTDDNGCQNRDSVNIVVHMLPTANAGKDTAICVGDTTHLSGDGGTQYAWQQERSLSATDIADPVAYPTQDQLYVLRVTDIHSCTDTDSVFIQVYELPNAEAGDDIAVCIGDSTQLTATGGIAYEWEATSGIADISVANPKLLLAGSSTISVLVTDANGCMAEDSVFVLVNALPLVEAGVEQEICLFEDAQLQASGANTYQWRLNASLSGTGIANPVASPVMTTLYQVEGTDQNGCKASDSLWVKVYPLPVIDVQDSVSICEGESVVLGAFTNSSLPLFWSNGETGESILLENPEEQYYQVVATTTMGCKDSARTFLEIVPLPEAIFSVDKDFDVEMLEVSFVNESLNATSYSWEFGDRATSTEENPTHTYTLTGEYETELIAYNELGCPDTTSVGPLTVQNIRIFIPSAFSPNGDGKNDEYFVVANGVEALSIQIFDRWGKVITELNSANATWDGTLNGQPVPLGTYPVTVRGISGKRRLPIKSSGTIVLFR